MPNENTAAVANLGGGHPGPPALRLLRGAISWAFFLGAAVGLAHLFHSRVAPPPADAAAPRQSASRAGITADRGASLATAPQWLAKLDAIARVNAAPVEICHQLRDLWPSLPEAGQMDALRRMVNLLPDADYGMIGEFAATAKLPAASWETLATDALTRPNPAKLPVLLEVAAHAAEPARSMARTELAAQLGTDYGEDWARWKEAVEGKTMKAE